MQFNQDLAMIALTPAELEDLERVHPNSYAQLRMVQIEIDRINKRN